ncbi:type I iodothyronine deiodinase-like [Asterias rubens]|uniref:type I iodothyronine deiodinase-like n=1 Tax=Asterias rubens TaxID=7604 RepID=UPI001454EA6B|nr:type I iodothyronine deiodinase-like [Asterias rubens]
MLQSQLACVLGGSLAQLFREYKDRADFLCVYLAEAHPAEYFNLNTTFKVPDHRTVAERIAAANLLLTADKEHHRTFTDDPLDDSLVRIVLDTMTNSFAQTYNAHPDRMFAFEGDKVAYIGDNIGKQMMEPSVLMTDNTRGWLESYFAVNGR